MKKCPNCQREFSDDMKFCLHDASFLIEVNENGGEEDLAPTMFVAPTVFVTPPAANSYQGQQAPPFEHQAPPFQPNMPANDFNAQTGFTGGQTQNPTQKRGNTFAWVGFWFMISAFVLTVLSIAGNWTKNGGRALYHDLGYDAAMLAATLIVMFITFIAIFFGAVGLFLRLFKPAKYGRLALSIVASMIGALLFGVQLLILFAGYLDEREFQLTRRNSTTNYSVNSVNSSPASADKKPAASLQTAILGKWRDSIGGEITFFADNSVLISDKTKGKVSSGHYEAGGGKITLLKDGVRVKEYKAFVSGNRLSLDGEWLTKVN